ncbi:MAG: CCXG family PEP-CTERM protein [Arenicella sp.]
MVQVFKWLKRLILVGIFGVCFSDAIAYSTRVPVTITNPTAAVLTNHTIRIELNAGNAPGFNWLNNGDDILVTDSAFNALDYYLESFDGGGQTAVVWIEVPSIPVSPPDTTVYIYYDDATATSTSSAANTFVNSGFKYHTQPYSDAAPGPLSRAAGEAIFNFDSVTTNTNYGCSALGSIEVDNSGTYGSNGDIAYFYETFFEVPVGATYEFRMGNDFGHGGELYVDGTTVEADWANDLWWGLNYSNADTLTGSIALSAGTHTLKALGFERCCDGPAGIQYRTSPVGPWVDFEVGSPGLTLYAPSCPVESNVIGLPESVPVTLSEFDSRKIGPYFRFEWQTASETFNVGFNIWANIDDEWMPLNRRVIRSRSTDSTRPQAYRYDFNNAKRQLPIQKIALSSVDVTGKEDFHGPFELNKQYGQGQLPEPINWQAIRSQYAQRMQEKGYQYINYRWRKPSKRALKDSSRIALDIDEKGIYRVTYDDLRAQGIDWQKISKKHIAVSYQGQAVSRFVGGGGRKFGPGSYIDFFANVPQGRDALYADQSVYTLSLKPDFRRRAARVKRKPESLDEWHFVTEHIEQQNYYNELSPLGDPWQMDELFTVNQPVVQSYAFTIDQAIIDDQSAVFKGAFSGITDLPEQDTDGDGEFDDEHHVQVYINDMEEPVYDGSFDGIEAWLVEVSFPAHFLKFGENTVRIQLPGDTGYRFDLVGIDELTIAYPVSSVAASLDKIDSPSDAQATDGIAFKAENRRNLVAYAYLEDHNLARLSVAKVRKGKFAVPKIAQGVANYWISTVEQLLKPSSLYVLPDSDVLVNQSTKLLIVSHPNFIGEALQAYAKARADAGVSNQIVSTDDIANSYGIDVPLPTAIKRFLQDVSKQVEYESVLLVGGHSYDYLNNLNADPNAETINFLPTFYRPVWIINYNPTDLPFVDFDDDGRPEKSIGRWPVRSLDDLQTIVDKSLSWLANADGRAENGLKVVMVADENDGLDFDRALDDVGQHMVAGGVALQSLQKIYVDELKQDPSVPANSVFQTAQNQLLDAVNQEADWLIYNGHASPSVWSFRSILNTQAVAQMSNVDHPMVVMPLACYTTYYESPTNNTLAHQLLFNGDRGAVAIHGAMMLGEYYGNLKMAEEILKTPDTIKTIGGVIQSAKRRLPVNYLNTSYNWALLGDPSLPMQ